MTAFRVWVAAHFPLTEDETYYWAWSTHPAWGYLDHPPVVAWLITSTAWLGHGSLAVRLPSILCEAGAALALGGAVWTVSSDVRAANAATLIVLFLPQTRAMIGQALPDPPYLFFWALALLFAARFARLPSIGRALPLGVAIGLDLLSRFFGWALLGGIAAWSLLPENRHFWKRGLPVALGLALLLYVPFLVYDAHHGWQNLRFTLHQREHPQPFSMKHVSVLSTARFLIFDALFIAAAFAATLRGRLSLFAWTALPFPLFLGALAFFAPVESYWLLGPFISLSGALAIRAVSWKRAARTAAAIAWSAAAAYSMAAVLFAALPQNAQASMLLATHGALKGPFYSPVYMYRALSRRSGELARAHRAAVATDRFEIASQLNYYGVRALMLGSSPQVGPWNHWAGIRALPSRLLLVTYAPVNRDPALAAALRADYPVVRAGPVLRLRFAGTSARNFYTTWCLGAISSPPPSLKPSAGRP